MFCRNCGAENTDGAKFCEKCGKPLDAENTQDVKKSTAHVAAAEGTMSKISLKLGQADKLKKMISPKYLAGIGAGVVVVAGGAIFAVNAGKTIQLDKYLLFETSGCEGYGNAVVEIDWDAIKSKYGSKMEFTSEAKDEFGKSLKGVKPIDFIQDYISVQLENDNKLSNGDVVAYTWDVDEDLSDYINCKFKYKDSEYKISDLPEAQTFDAFDGVMITFSGTEPKGIADLKYTGLEQELDSYDFDISQSFGLSNGDVVKVSIREAAVERCAKELGRVPAGTEMEYTVEGLEGYLSKLAELDNVTLDEMKQQAEDAYLAEAARNWSDDETLESFTYLGDYLLTSKKAENHENYLYLIYKVQIHNFYSSEEGSYDGINDLYWFIQFENLMIDSNSKVKVDVTRYKTPGNQIEMDSGIHEGYWGNKRWSYKGYKTLDDLYKDVVTAQSDSFNHEENIDESAAPASVEKQTVTQTGYILPDSSTELVTEADLEALSDEDCKIALNEIYARHGRKFKDADLQAHFAACDWYSGTIEPDDFSDSVLSETEIANRDLIVAYEEAHGIR